jgi:hypothetical protein
MFMRANRSAPTTCAHQLTRFYGGRGPVGTLEVKEIRAQATAGLLPPWGTGWPEDVWRRLIPDAALRAQFADELRPTPFGLYEEPVSWSETWPDAPCRYLRFSALYADEENEAQRSGWVTREIPGDHLHMLVGPVDVAECLIGLA